MRTLRRWSTWELQTVCISFAAGGIVSSQNTPGQPFVGLLTVVFLVAWVVLYRRAYKREQRLEKQMQEWQR
jgi:hypothetical protein